MISNNWIRRALVITLVSTLTGFGFLTQPGTAGATAANKMTVSGSFTQVLCDATVQGVPCLKGDTGNNGLDGIDLLDGTIKTSSTVAIQITASVECSLATNVSLVLDTNTSSGATATVVFWVTISNGSTTIIVPVDPNAGSAGPGFPPNGSDPSTKSLFSEQYNGMVTACDRSIVLKSSGFATTGTLSLLEATTSAYSFTWVSKPLNQIGGISCTGGCKVVLNAAIGGSVTTTNNEALAAITNRTMVVEPVNSGNTITF